MTLSFRTVPLVMLGIFAVTGLGLFALTGQLSAFQDTADDDTPGLTPSGFIKIATRWMAAPEMTGAP